MLPAPASRPLRLLVGPPLTVCVPRGGSAEAHRPGLPATAGHGGVVGVVPLVLRRNLQPCLVSPRPELDATAPCLLLRHWSLLARLMAGRTPILIAYLAELKTLGVRTILNSGLEAPPGLSPTRGRSLAVLCLQQLSLPPRRVCHPIIPPSPIQPPMSQPRLEVAAAPSVAQPSEVGVLPLLETLGVCGATGIVTPPPLLAVEAGRIVDERMPVARLLPLELELANLSLLELLVLFPLQLLLRELWLGVAALGPVPGAVAAVGPPGAMHSAVLRSRGGVGHRLLRMPPYLQGRHPEPTPDLLDPMSKLAHLLRVHPTAPQVAPQLLTVKVKLSELDEDCLIHLAWTGLGLGGLEGVLRRMGA